MKPHATAIAAVTLLVAAACGDSADTTSAARSGTATSIAVDSEAETAIGHLAELDARVGAGDYGEITSLLIWHDGATVFESYYRGTDQETLHPMYSIFKSIRVAAVGVAVNHGHIGGVDDRVLSYFPDSSPENLDSRKEALSVEDLLTMRAGFVWSEERSFDLRDAATSLDPIQFMLDREMDSNPGDEFNYNTGASWLLGGVLQSGTGTAMATYVAANVLGPIGIGASDYEWDPISGISMKPSDMLKFGQLYLQQGAWEGEQVIPAEWVVQSTLPWATGAEIEDQPFDYGYQWWRFSADHPVAADIAVNDLYFASGRGGHKIIVVPHLDVVVVTTAENPANTTLFFPALSEFVFPAFS